MKKSVRLRLEDWKKEYKNKTKSKEEVIRHVKLGNRIVFANAAGEPTIIVDYNNPIINLNI